MKINTIIVDDEPLSRQGIKLRLVPDDEINIIEECGNGKTALAAINKLKPDLVYLDIQMPEMDGFEVVKMIKPELWPFIIFVTAYDKYAIKAFEINALDYLLKPISDERFVHSLRRAKEEIFKKNLLAFSQKLTSLVDDFSGKKPETIKERYTSSENRIDRLIVKNKGCLSFVKIDDIEWIQAAGDYVYIYMNNKKILHRETMSNLEKILNPVNFKRIHRSTIININLVKQIINSDHGDCYLVMVNGTKLKLSRNYKESLKHILKSGC